MYSSPWNNGLVAADPSRTRSCGTQKSHTLSHFCIGPSTQLLYFWDWPTHSAPRLFVIHSLSHLPSQHQGHDVRLMFDFHCAYLFSLPRGILLHGPPGTGKTHIVRCLASECAKYCDQPVAFFSHKASECLSENVGETEEALRIIFEEVLSDPLC